MGSITGIKGTKSIKGIKEIIKILLKNRGIKTKSDREMFFNPPNPKKFSAKDLGINETQLKRAVQRIKQAVGSGEKIIVYGDYDVDGICATAILWETLFALGANVLPYIPSRFTEGYGLNEESIKKLKKDDPELGLIITVDHGIVAHKKIDFAKTLGVDIIVTDHHEPGKTKPEACTVVHTTKISGSAVVLILARELLKKIQNPNDKTQIDHLGLVALGTVADVLPVVGVNRSFVVHGLKELRITDRPGIKAICEEASIKQEEINTYHIGFIIGPRLNAAGRIEHAMDSLRLLCVKKTAQAKELALKLGRVNRLRQEKTNVAAQHIEENFSLVWKEKGVPKLLFVEHESYEEGIIGVVAGKLAEKYYRPAIVVSRGNEFSKASARSISGVNIVEMIKGVGEEFFVGVGGHKMAAGFTIRTEQIKVLKEHLFAISEEMIKDADLIRKVRVDCDLEFGDLSGFLYRELQKFTPYGFGNLEPTFRTKEVLVEDARLVGKDNSHLKLQLAKGESIDAIGFRMGEWYTKLSPEKPVDIIYSIIMDTWNGGNKLQLKIKNIQIHG